MIPSARFGDILISYTGNDYIICHLYSLYEGGIENVAANKEFCLYILTELYNKVSLHDRAIMEWNGNISREEAAALYNNADETTQLFYREARALLNGSTDNDPNGSVNVKNEAKFREIASKVIKDFRISDNWDMDDTFKEYCVLEITVNNTKLISHIAGGLRMEC